MGKTLSLKGMVEGIYFTEGFKRFWRLKVLCGGNDVVRSNARVMSHWGSIVLSFLQCKSNKYYIFWAYVRSLRCPACNAHAQFCHLSLLHIISQTHDFRKILLNIKCVVWFSLTTFVWNVSHSKKNRARYEQKRILVFTKSARYSCQILIRPEFFSTGFRKALKYQI